ncbi:PREDICTED: uncharacterized protein LOC108767420 [Trachymyrmex cornetzi]|uniref:uncharacterized protein LOC108767420 n=1 Tax=Trachymyrmex cornetzi TaxID=471704 RepID=UPI00084F6D10|nr:PREDICTED: uncharacterized protein LOC108767420 [Trachymyrmex cornetzi]
MSVILSSEIRQPGTQMYATLQQADKSSTGKRIGRHQLEPPTTVSRYVSPRLHVTDKITGLIFLIDTGADISLTNSREQRSSLTDTTCPIRSQRLASQNLRTKATYVRSGSRPIPWHFTIADVSRPVIEADLLKHYGLIVDIQGECLIDNITRLNIPGFKRRISYVVANILDSTSAYHHILASYPGITTEPRLPIKRSHGIVHHIQTREPPIASRPRRLPPDKLKTAKAEFAHLMQLGVCRPSNNP